MISTQDFKQFLYHSLEEFNLTASKKSSIYKQLEEISKDDNYLYNLNKMITMKSQRNFSISNFDIIQCGFTNLPMMSNEPSLLTEPNEFLGHVIYALLLNRTYVANIQIAELNDLLFHWLFSYDDLMEYYGRLKSIGLQNSFIADFFNDLVKLERIYLNYNIFLEREEYAKRLLKEIIPRIRRGQV